MRTRILLVVAYSLTMFLLTPTANASLVDMGTYSSDAASGLDWLELTQTAGLSWNEVTILIGSGGSLEGWRYATGEEFDAMVTGMDGIPTSGTTYTGWSIANNGIVDTLLPHFGDLTGNRYSLGILADEIAWATDVRYAAALLDDPSEARAAAEDYIRTHDETRSGDHTDAGTGSFLVSSTAVIPEPTTMLLLGSGLIGLAGFRRKNKKT